MKLRLKHLLVPKIGVAIGILLMLDLTCAIASAGLWAASDAPETKKLMVSEGMDQATHLGCSKCSARSPDSVQDKFAPRDAQVGWEGLFNGITPYGAWKTSPLP